MNRRGFFGMLSTVLAAARVKAPDPVIKPLKFLVQHKDRYSAVNFYSGDNTSSTTITFGPDYFDIETFQKFSRQVFRYGKGHNFLHVAPESEPSSTA